MILVYGQVFKFIIDDTFNLMFPVIQDSETEESKKSIVDR